MITGKVAHKAAWELIKVNTDLNSSKDANSELIDIQTYNAEKILDHRITRYTVKYLIKWEGYNAEEDNTWENYTNIRLGRVNALSPIEMEYMKDLDASMRASLLSKVNVVEKYSR